MRLDISPDDETSYTTQYQSAFLKCLEDEYCAKHRRVLVNTLEYLPISTLIPFPVDSGFSDSSFDPNELSSDHEKYLTPNDVPEMTPGLSDWAADLLTAAGNYLNPPCEEPTNWVQSNPNLYDYHSHPRDIKSTF
jgi:hypothetical protein